MIFNATGAKDAKGETGCSRMHLTSIRAVERPHTEVRAGAWPKHDGCATDGMTFAFQLTVSGFHGNLSKR